jgi:uncharacterized membrane protein YhaH (DUF805 family)
VKISEREVKRGGYLIRFLCLIIVIVGILVIYNTYISAEALGGAVVIFYIIGIIILVAGALPLFSKLS